MSLEATLRKEMDSGEAERQMHAALRSQASDQASRLQSQFQPNGWNSDGVPAGNPWSRNTMPYMYAIVQKTQQQLPVKVQYRMQGKNFGKQINDAIQAVIDTQSSQEFALSAYEAWEWELFNIDQELMLLYARMGSKEKNAFDHRVENISTELRAHRNNLKTVTRRGDVHNLGLQWHDELSSFTNRTESKITPEATGPAAASGGNMGFVQKTLRFLRGGR